MKTAEEIKRGLALEERKVNALERIADALEAAQAGPNYGFHIKTEEA